MSTIRQPLQFGSSGSSSSGDVVGPASSTDNALARWDLATGKLLQNSTVLVGDTGAITGVASLSTTGTVSAAGVVRLANGATISWRKQDDSGDVTLASLASPGDSLSFSGNGIFCPTANAGIAVGSSSTFGYGFYSRNDNGFFMLGGNGSDTGYSIERGVAGQVKIATGSAGRWLSLNDGDGSVDVLKVKGGKILFSNYIMSPNEFDAGNSGAATKALDWVNGSAQKVTMTGSCTFTLANPVTGGVYILKLVESGAGSWVPTWPGTVLWPSGIAPTLSVLNKTDVITLYWDGTNYYGNSQLNYG